MYLAKKDNLRDNLYNVNKNSYARRKYYKKHHQFFRSQLEIKNTTLTNNNKNNAYAEDNMQMESYIEEKLEGMLEKFKYELEIRDIKIGHQMEMILSLLEMQQTITDRLEKKIERTTQMLSARKQKEATQVTIGTFNVQSVKWKNDILKATPQKLDLCCLQKHWLFKPEQHLLHDIDTNMIVTAKSIDDENPELSMIAPSKDLTQYVQILDMEAENTSDHVPVIATIKRKLIRKSNKPKSVIVRTKWEKCNLQKYQLTISDGVEKILQASNKKI
ncbi:unnamed protein product [Mytilus coruscus]|uniref:Endonuclease/exonuclease/phosphatase domain-containing protein n=1 Tax=Mytilus coruscus TaxID=42192 RepID=A0A6J8ER37_MYTCO|nr:unnamed protein product [Mytilus coruscus]